MHYKLIKISIAVMLSILTFFFNNYYGLGVFYFYTILSLLSLDILHKKKITLLHIWNIAFVFIILSEVFRVPKYDVTYGLNALKFLLIANNIIYIGYLSKQKAVFNNHVIFIVKNKSNIYSLFLLIALVIIYIAMTYKGAINAFVFGRNVSQSSTEEGVSFVVGTIINSLGFVLPAIIAYYFLLVRKTGLILPFLLSLPIFIILFLTGTRFPLLFSLLGFVITVLNKYKAKLTLKKIILIGGTGLLLITSSILMKEFRTSYSKNKINPKEKIIRYKDLPTYASQYMSSEGIIDMTSLMFKHFETNDHLYGKSSSFLLYFWIPRAIWHDKPTMLGYWLIRKYRSGFSKGNNVSFGFTGEFYSDFGFFSLFIVFFLGRLLKYGECFKDFVFSRGGYNLIIGSMLFPYVFFFVRSPITSTTFFVGIIFFHSIIKLVIFQTKKK